jgi:hypothetical protein
MIHDDNSFIMQTAATLGVSRAKRNSRHSDFTTTLAAAMPEGFCPTALSSSHFDECYDGQPTKAKPSQIDKGSHAGNLLTRLRDPHGVVRGNPREERACRVAIPSRVRKYMRFGQKNLAIFTSYFMALSALSPAVWAGVETQYTVNVNQSREAALDSAITTTHQGQTKAQVVQRALNRYLQDLKDQQQAEDLAFLALKLEDASNAGRNNANAALLATISAPQVTNPGTQTSTVGVPITPLAITATDTDARPLTMAATNLPTGLQIQGLTIVGTPTTIQTPTVTLQVYKYADKSVFTQVSFTWNVVTP